MVYSYRRGLASSCINTIEYYSSLNNANLWSCGSTFDYQHLRFTPDHYSRMNIIDSAPASDYVLNYTDADGV